MPMPAWPSLSALAVACLLAAACTAAPVDAVDEQAAADANAALGIDYLRKGYEQEAVTRLKRALSYDPDHADAHWGLAIVYSRLHEFERAERHFKAALAAKPAPEIYNNYGAFLCARGRTEEAVDRFSTAAANPRYTRPADALANAGLCLYRAGQQDAAEGYLRRALDKNAEHPRALALLARLYYDRGDYLRARAFLQRRQAVAELEGDLLLLAARNELALGNGDEAGRYLARYNQAAASAERVTLEQLVSDEHD